MSYATWQDLAARYKKFAEDYDSSEAQIGFMNGADADIDARLSLRYVVPFNPVPSAIKDIAIDLAYWKMTIGQESAKELKKYIDQRLDSLSAGSTSLVVSGTLLGTLENLPWSDTMNRRTQFGVDAPENWNVSADWEDDEQDKRTND